MRMRGSNLMWTAMTLTILVSGCAIKVDPPQIKVNSPGGQLGAGVTTCNVTADGGSTVDANKPVTLTVDVGNSNYNILVYPPFQVSGVDGSFQSQTFNVTKTFSNDGAQKTVTGELVITDSKGATLSCGYTFTVRAATSSSLACSLEVSPGSPKAGESFVAIATASGGVLPYTFSNFSLGAGGTIVSDISDFSSTVVVGSGKYSTGGAKVVTVKLVDHSGATVTCSKGITVQSAPVVTLSASPSSSVSATSSILLTATPSGFTGTPSYVWSTSESGVAIQSLGNTALVSSQDGKAHSFTLNVSATSGSQTATASQALQFTTTTSSTLTCTVRVTDAWWDWDDYFGWYFVADVSAVPTNASGGAWLTNVSVPVGSVVTYLQGLDAELIYQPQASFSVGADIQDGAGRSAHCTSVTIDPSQYWY